MVMLTDVYAPWTHREEKGYVPVEHEGLQAVYDRAQVPLWEVESRFWLLDRLLKPGMTDQAVLMRDASAAGTRAVALETLEEWAVAALERGELEHRVV